MGHSCLEQKEKETNWWNHILALRPSPGKWHVSLAHTFHWSQHVNVYARYEWERNINFPEGVLSGKGFGKEGQRGHTSNIFIESIDVISEI